MRISKKNFAKVAEGLIESKQAAFVLNWPVFESYRILSGTVYADGEATHIVRPLEDEDFFTSFARLASRGYPSEASLLQWVHRYGLLTQHQTLMRVEEFRREAHCAHELLRLLRDLWARDVDAIRARWTTPWFNYPQTSVQGYFHKFQKVRTLSGEESDETIIQLGIAAFESLIEEKLSKVRLSHARYVPETRISDTRLSDVPGLQEKLGLGHVEDPSKIRLASSKSHPATREPYHPQRSYRCPDLRSALYFQLDLAYVDQKPIRYCASPVCGQPFFLTRSDKRYCNSTCRSNARHYRSKTDRN